MHFFHILVLLSPSQLLRLLHTLLASACPCQEYQRGKAMLVSLPEKLESAIEAALRDLPSSQWMKAARIVSERYRARRNGTESPLVRGAHEALGYSAIILPAAYAQLSGAMTALHARIPQWQPTSMLDIGSGPGTALWAAIEQWPSLQTLTAWERESAFIDLGRIFAAASDKQALNTAHWERVVLGKNLPGPLPMYDLVVFGHVLNELPEMVRQTALEMAWKQCSGVLLIVEPGTSSAFPIVKAAREQLLRQGAFTLTPCAHDNECPLHNDWCHFPQRLRRPCFQRQARDASAGWEESKFSYAAMAHTPPEQAIWGRLIHQPHIQKGFVELTISSKDGLVQTRVLKRDRAMYRQLASYEWGEMLTTPIDSE
jgi:ribosomal protein RSM22 (predicted rRNA methylase)